MSLLAIDVGSSSCKAVVFGDGACVLAQASYSYHSHAVRPSWAELPAEEFWRGFLKVTHAVSTQVNSDPIRVLAISSHGETFVPVDSKGLAIAPAILNMDNRAVTEATDIEQQIGRKRLFQITGLTSHAMYPAAKISWLRKNASILFQSACKYLAVPDYVLTRLGLPPYIDYSLASRFLLFDIRKKNWSDELLSFCELSREQLPNPVPAGTVAGKLSAEIAGELGVQAGTLVVVGGHDQPCGALGSGVLQPGRVSASLGTYECVVAASSRPALTQRALDANLNSYCHVVPERYVTLSYFPSGIMLDWFLRLIDSSSDPAKTSVEQIRASLESKSRIEPSGLLITPHLLGTCNPDFNPHASGVIAGIRPSTTASDLYQGILEGVACEFANMCDLLQEAAGEFGEVLVSGGGVRSALGLRLRASLSGRDLQVLKHQEAVCLGTAILAALAVGDYGSFNEAADRMVVVSETVSPDLDVSKRYRNHQQRYSVLYSSLATLRHALEVCQEEK